MSAGYIELQQRKAFDVRREFRKQQDNQQETDHQKEQYEAFYKLCEEIKEFIYTEYDRLVENTKDSNQYVEIFHRALIGEPKDVAWLEGQIKDYIQRNALDEMEYPYFYLSLPQAVLEETFGWGPLSVWKTKWDSEAAQVIGTDIKFQTKDGWELQDFSFRSLDQVEDVYYRLANVDKSNQLNEHTKTELETKTYEGFRVSIMIPNRTYEEPVITMRRKVLTRPSFQEQADFKTIPIEAIRVFQILSRLQLNSLVAGPPACGKSTFLMTMLDEVLLDKDGNPEKINTLFAESSPEFPVRRMFTRANVIPVIGEGEEFEKVISKSLLRHDISRVVVSEIREHETGLYQRASLQGIKQLMGTLHDLDPLDIPEILTNLYMQYHSSRLNPNNVYKRFSRNIHFTITMDQVAIDQKRVTGVQFYDFDPQTLEVSVHKIMHYDYGTGEFSFHDYIPERILRLAIKYHPSEVEELQFLLGELRSEKPMFENDRTQSTHYKGG